MRAPTRMVTQTRMAMVITRLGVNPSTVGPTLSLTKGGLVIGMPEVGTDKRLVKCVG